MSEGRNTNYSHEVMLTVFLIADIATVGATITGISPTGVTATILFFENDLSECVASIRGGYSWIKVVVETVLGTFSGVLVVRRAAEGRSDEMEIRFAVN